MFSKDTTEETGLGEPPPELFFLDLRFLAAVDVGDSPPAASALSADAGPGSPVGVPPPPTDDDDEVRCWRAAAGDAWGSGFNF